MGRLYKLSVKIQLVLCDKMIIHILLYGCEVWGFGKNEVLERVHLKFCKILLNLKSSTPNYMVYGELGGYPIDIDIKVRTISYWARLLSGKQAKFSNVFYRLSRNLNENGDTNLNLKVFCRISSELVLVLHFCQIPRPRNHIREYVLSFYQRDLAGFSPIIYIIFPF
jgi:hypothetical protein